ncbi:MAG TPA: sigma-70 family RNA polymerase sigma factor [Candidatus Eisenbergiella merdavium]|uniref:Sigma-70 family RNA polymerase sigma factor n=1 Tax=Candidatus Eisenbergiella merdavium TaxID=2838551 RepID=A0A9D2NGD2_9FIRM|nr:sigma-70 family RNA polymerase sigma factor [Candidatus Eisenbergiella merdavium]
MIKSAASSTAPDSEKIQRVTTMDEQSRKLSEDHLYLVRRIVLGTIGLNESIQGLGYDDLYQVGCEGLCHAAINYDDSYQTPFSAFAATVIRNRLISHCRNVGRLQARLNYLDAPTGCEDGLTGQDLLADNLSIQEGLTDEEALSLLKEVEKDYTGVCRKGIEALRFRFMGHSCKEIAAHYGVKPNHVSAWISRAGKRLRTDKRFSCLQH